MTSSSNIPAAPVFTKEDADRIRVVFPAEMVERPQWVAYQMIWKDDKGKFTKKPVDPHNGRGARTNDPSTWGAFEQAVEIAIRRKLGGVGFVFNKADPYCGIDIDDAAEEDGLWKAETQEIIAELNSYTERSPSGRGCHIIGRGILPPGGRRRGCIEMYDHARFFTVTGIVDGPGVLRDIQTELDAFHARIFDRRNIKIAETRRDFDAIPFPALSDAEVVETASQDPERGEKFAALWRGQWRELGYPSPSEADLALCSRIAYYVNFDPVRIDAIFRQSGLFRPEKWDQSHHADGRTYGQGTVDKAVSDRGDRKGYRPGGQATRPPLQTSLDGRITITVNRQLNKVLADAWALVNFANNQPGGPRLFQRAGAIVRIRQDDGAPYIAPMTKEALTTFLYENADWISWGEKSYKPSKPQPDVVAGMLCYPATALPRLDVLAQTPFFTTKGDLIQSDGYYANLHIWLKLSADLREIAVPDEPNDREIRGALSLFMDDLLVDFPFAERSDRANCLGSFLLPFVRTLINDVTPLHLFEAPTPGSGKGLLASLISILATGEEVVVQVFPYQEEELRKRLSSELLKGRAVIAFDNADSRRQLDSATLAAVLTATVWGDRELGRIGDVTLPNNSIWMMTANNLSLSSEMADRTIRIRIDPKSERPRERDPSRFKHHPIKQWVRERRRELVTAALTLARAWIVAGRPFQGREYGSFEAWSRVIGGILEFVGVKGFMENRHEFYERSDSDLKMWHDFVNAWWEKFGDRAVQAKQLNDLCEEQELMLPLRRDGSERSQLTRLGSALRRARDSVKGDFRVHTDVYVMNAAGSHRNNGYRLTRADAEESIGLSGSDGELFPSEEFSAQEGSNEGAPF